MNENYKPENLELMGLAIILFFISNITLIYNEKFTTIWKEVFSKGNQNN